MWSMHRRLWTIGGLLILLHSPAASARAVDKTYIGGPGTGTWSVNSSWSPFGVPRDNDNVFLRPTDSIDRVAVFDGAGSLAFDYGAVTIQPFGPSTMGLHNAGAFFAAQAIVLHDRGEYRTTASGSRTVVSSIFVNGGTFSHSQGTLSATNITQSGGTLQASFVTLSNRYLMEGGTFNPGLLVNTGTFDFAGGSVLTGHFDNRGTIVHRAGAGSLLANVENHGTILFHGADATFSGLTNHQSLTLPADSSIAIFGPIGVHQTAGTFTQFGDVNTVRVFIGNATWDQRSGALTISGANDELHVGTSSNGVPQPATFLMSGGSVQAETARILVGNQTSSGTFAQSGGSVRVDQLHIGLNGGRGTFNMSGGSLTATATYVGLTPSGVGTFVQTGGAVDAGTLTNVAMVSIGGGTFRAPIVQNEAVFLQSGGAAEVPRIQGVGRVSVGGTGSLTIGSIDQEAVHVSGGGRILPIAGFPPSRTSRVDLLDFDESGGVVHGTWDLGPGALIVNYVAASPIDSVRRFLAGGHAAGNWTGAGLTSSTAAASSGKRGLAYAESRDMFGQFGGSFAGLFADPTSVVVGLRLYGDANLDGVVNLADFNRLAGNFGATGAVWFQGDFNYDGIVNLADFNRLAANFGLSALGPDGPTPEDWSALASAVPEPGVNILGLPLGVAALRRRRK